MRFDYCEVVMQAVEDSGVSLDAWVKRAHASVLEERLRCVYVCLKSECQL